MDILAQTKYASAERKDNNTIDKQKSVINRLNDIKLFFNNIPAYILILNKQRQIIFANEPFQKFFNSNNIYGMRTGECLGCIHAFKEVGGCGTSEYCSQCGAVNSILNSQKDGFSINECRITKENNEVFDFSIWAKSICIEGNDFTLFSFRDISDEKRRQVLERIFFHDVLNTAGSLKNFLGLINQGSCDELESYLSITENISNKLIDEIISQRTLTQAENGELQLELTNISTKEILEEIILLYQNHPVSKNKEIIIESGSTDIIIETDKTILRRILSNLTKNALEACLENETVLLGCSEINNKVKFYVKNPNYIPKAIQLQIFQRSFSTKSAGRGIGTYSIKLLTERYLNGTVEFNSTNENGTMFSVFYNKKITSHI